MLIVVVVGSGSAVVSYSVIGASIPACRVGVGRVFPVVVFGVVASAVVCACCAYFGIRRASDFCSFVCFVRVLFPVLVRVAFEIIVPTFPWRQPGRTSMPCGKRYSGKVVMNGAVSCVVQLAG